MRGRRRENRSGVAATELALCLPLLVLLVLGSIESCNMIFLRHSLSVAGYEAVRTAARRVATATDAENAGNAMLVGRGIQGADVAVIPSDLSTLQAGQLVTVRVTAQADQNRVIAPWFFWGRVVESSATMARE